MTKKKRRKIHKQQARNWMDVAHTTMHLFPERFMHGVSPGAAPGIVVSLLVDLAERRGKVLE